jgi:pimeloyl-ACP methyl ester carboxylesterase
MPKQPQSFARKALAGPPEEFAEHILPDPKIGGIDSESSSYFVTLNPIGHQQLSWSHIMDVDSLMGFSLNVFSPIDEHLTYSLKDPKGNQVDLAKYGTPTFWPIWDSTEQTVKGTSYNVDTSLDGEYVLTVTASKDLNELNALVTERTGQRADIKHGYVVLFNPNADRIYSQFTAYNMQQGDEVGLLAEMFDTTAHPEGRAVGVVPNALRDVVQSATLLAVFPDGHRVAKQMHDDGLHGDGLANDGMYGATFTASEEGSYVVQSILEGVNVNGPFYRTNEHLAVIIPRSIQFTNNAFGEMFGNILKVNLEVSGTPKGSYRPYFQLWGQDAAGSAVAVGWFSSLEDVETVQSRSVLSLDVDVAWITRSGAKAPFTLRDVYVQDVTTWNPVSRADAIDLTLPSGVVADLEAAVHRLSSNGYKGDITLEMMQGPLPPRSNATNGGKLIMLHGYCADKNPWQVYPEDWTDALYFLNAKANMPHDDYAQRILAFATQNDVSSFGLVGHSQGGIVTLHTYNYYATGLDLAVGPRKIQSLASPYLGNTAAGSTANVGKVFGLGCGSNYDMSVDGAPLWFAGISANARAQANYYTTQYNKGGLFGEGWCNMLVNAIIKKPNDGTTEMVFAAVQGGNHRSHVVGQCHIDGMNWPASYWDHARNAEMNSQAAR